MEEGDEELHVEEDDDDTDMEKIDGMVEDDGAGTAGEEKI